MVDLSNDFDLILEIWLNFHINMNFVQMSAVEPNSHSSSDNNNRGE